MPFCARNIPRWPMHREHVEVPSKKPAGLASWYLTLKRNRVAEYNKLFAKLARLRCVADDMLLDLSRAHALESDKGQVYRRQMHDAAAMLRTMKDFAFDISGIYRSKQTRRG